MNLARNLFGSSIRFHTDLIRRTFSTGKHVNEHKKRKEYIYFGDWVARYQRSRALRLGFPHVGALQDSLSINGTKDVAALTRLRQELDKILRNDGVSNCEWSKATEFRGKRNVISHPLEKLTALNVRKAAKRDLKRLSRISNDVFDSDTKKKAVARMEVLASILAAGAALGFGSRAGADPIEDDIQ